MHKEMLTIEGIPAVLWGEKDGPLWVAVHGDQSNKEDAALALAAQVFAGKGGRMLSFDLPNHGARPQGNPAHMVRDSVGDLRTVMAYARGLSARVSLFACSLGAYFSLLAYQDEPLEKALFLSPVVDMERLLGSMMGWFDVTEARLKAEGEIETPVKTLYWDYYSDVKAHPVVRWEAPTEILYGEKDEVSEREAIDGFVAHTEAGLTVMEGGEHYFHTPPQMAFLEKWLTEHA